MTMLDALQSSPTEARSFESAGTRGAFIAPVLAHAHVEAPRAGVVRRALAYGLLGWCMEVVFTGVTNAIANRDRALRSHTYLWMFPIYALGGLWLERIEHRLAPRLPRAARALAYVGAVYA